MKKNDIAEKLCRRGTKCQYSGSDRIMISSPPIDRLPTLCPHFTFSSSVHSWLQQTECNYIYHRDHVYWTTSPLFKCQLVTFSGTCNLTIPNTHLKIVQDLGTLIHGDSVLNLDDHVPVRGLVDGYSKGADCGGGRQQEHKGPAEHCRFLPHFHVLLFVCCTTS